MLKFSLKPQNSSVERFIKVLEQGARLIQNLNDTAYQKRDAKNQSSTGSHFRHVIEFVFRLCGGISAGKVDYNQRQRDVMIEQNREYAVSQFNLAIKQLHDLPVNIENKQILLRLETSEIDAGWCISSVLRELEYLQSHTIHHYALIAEKLSAQGITVEKDFGVSPSTLQFWKEKQLPKKLVYAHY